MVADKTADETAGSRPPRGRPFPPGKSGNPGGRPRGSRNKTTLACLDLLDGEGEAITRTAIERAKAGDAVALRLVVERVLPRGRGRAVEIELPAMEKAADLVEGCAAIIDAAAHGELTLGEAREFMALLDGQRKAIESQELAVRVELLEEEFRKVRKRS